MDETSCGEKAPQREDGRSLGEEGDVVRDRILLIEDDVEVASRLQEHLERYGFSVVRVENFQDIVGEVQAAAPDIVVLSQ